MNMSEFVAVGDGPQPGSGAFAAMGTLPRVPLPDLEESFARLLDWSQPLLDEAEMAQTRAALDALQPLAAQLHEKLLAFDRDEAFSWLDRFWPARYLGRRTPVAINANFVFTFHEAPLNQVQRAAQLIRAAVGFKLALDAGELSPPQRRGQGLCPHQYKYLFSTTRIPGDPCDDVASPFSAQRPGPSSARHILVLHRQQLFRLDVIDAAGRPCSGAQLQGALQQLLAAPATQQGCGWFTALPRSDWADARSRLLQAHPDNAAVLDEIGSALFAVCLDDAAPDSPLALADQLLIGDGGNRWFDKSISFIVTANGGAGVNVEHCGLDGGTVVEFVDALHASPLFDAWRDDAAAAGECAPQPLQLVLDDALRQTLQQAAAAFTTQAQNSASALVEFSDFGAQGIRRFGVSPDAFAQMAFQLANHRARGVVGSVYESVAVRGYERGRTEAMRVTTPQAAAFVRAMAANVDPAAQAQALRAAMQAHSERIKQCQQGAAPEQHLWQLQMLAQHWPQAADIRSAWGENKLREGLRFYDSPGWRKLRNDSLSTSSAPSPHVSVFAFGATNAQCIGVAYRVSADAISAYLSTTTAAAATMHAFGQHLQTACADMAALLQGSEP